jgi:hypothetical protein
VHPATRQPYPDDAGLRPVVLRPTLSSGLPLTGSSLVCKVCKEYVKDEVVGLFE